MRISNRINYKVSNNSEISATSHHQIFTTKVEDLRLALSNLKVKLLIEQLIKKLKFLVPPLKAPQHVQQQWQQDNEEVVNNQLQLQHKKQTLGEQLFNRFNIVKYVNILQGIMCIVFAWVVSVSVCYQVKILSQISLVNSILIILILLLKIKVVYQDLGKKQSTYSISWFDDFVQPLIFMVSNLLMILRSNIQNQNLQTIIQVFCLFTVLLEWQKIDRYFDLITIYAQQSKKRKQLRIAQLFCFSLIMVHIFSLIMYKMTEFCPPGQINWIQKAKLTDLPWYQIYIYAYYWANTTMVTVGYGDLVPSNYRQALIVTMIQILGAAIFGYMINVIGITVNQIQRKALSLQQQQSTLNKLKWHYQLSRELCYKMKMDIIKKDTLNKHQILKSEEEVQFLDSIDTSLKQQFVLQTNMKVIKKCIFFLTHFTINFINQIALKLIRCIYKNNEILDQENNGERKLIIINYGKVNIYVKKIRHNQQINKLVKVIELNQNKTLTSNMFGYSSLIMNKPINLKAVTQTQSTCYILKRQDVMESISKSILDFQSINELRQKMLQYRNIDQIQAQSLNQLQQHYIPNLFFLIKKIKYYTQDRHKVQRGIRKMKKIIITLNHYQNKTILYIPSDRQINRTRYNQMQQMQQLQQLNNVKQIKDNNQQFNKTLNIDFAKSYQKFFKSYNIAQVAVNYQASMMKKQMQIKKTLKKRSLKNIRTSLVF